MPDMSSSTLILFASTAVCILGALWRRTFVTTPSLDIPLVEFGDGDESKLRYTNETGRLLRQGYDKVRSVVIPILPANPLLPAYHHEQHLKHGQTFQIRNAGDPTRPLVFLPLQYMEEVRNAPQDRLSLPLYTEKAGHPFIQVFPTQFLYRSDRIFLGLYSEPH